MNMTTNKTITALFGEWRIEDRQLQSVIEELREWMCEVNQLGIPHFGEAGVRLRTLRQRLLLHFSREDAIIKGLAEAHRSGSPQVDNIGTRSADDHQQLLVRLDGLCERLTQLEPPFASWQAAMGEIESFVSALDSHEKEEYQDISTMLNAGNRDG